MLTERQNLQNRVIHMRIREVGLAPMDRRPRSFGDRRSESDDLMSNAVNDGVHSGARRATVRPRALGSWPKSRARRRGLAVHCRAGAFWRRAALALRVGLCAPDRQ